MVKRARLKVVLPWVTYWEVFTWGLQKQSCEPTGKANNIVVYKLGFYTLCHKAADVKEYDSLRSDFPNKLKELHYDYNDTKSNVSPRRIRLTEKVHLFRSISKINDKKYSAAEENLALLVDVHNILDYVNFIEYCTKRCQNISHVYFIR